MNADQIAQAVDEWEDRTGAALAMRITCAEFGTAGMAFRNLWQHLAEKVAATMPADAAAERKRIVALAEEAVREWQRDIDGGSNSASLLQGMIDGVRILLRRL